MGLGLSVEELKAVTVVVPTRRTAWPREGNPHRCEAMLSVFANDLDVEAHYFSH